MTSQCRFAIKSLTVKPSPRGTSNPPIPSMRRHWQRPAMRLIDLKTSTKCNRAVVSPGGDQRSDWLVKKERCDLVERQLAILSRVQEFRVCPAAGAEWFHRQRVAAALPQVVEEQARQQGFAHACVGAGDEDDACLASSVHAQS